MMTEMTMISWQWQISAAEDDAGLWQCMYNVRGRPCDAADSPMKREIQVVLLQRLEWGPVKRFLLNFVEGSRCISHRFLTFCLDFDERPVCPRLSVSITANLVLGQNQSPRVSTTIFTYKYKYIPTQILFSVDTNMENKKKPKYPRSMGILVT